LGGRLPQPLQHQFCPPRRTWRRDGERLPPGWWCNCCWALVLRNALFCARELLVRLICRHWVSLPTPPPHYTPHPPHTTPYPPPPPPPHTTTYSLNWFVSAGGTPTFLKALRTTGLFLFGFKHGCGAFAHELRRFTLPTILDELRMRRKTKQFDTTALPLRVLLFLPSPSPFMPHRARHYAARTGVIPRVAARAAHTHTTTQTGTRMG